MEIVEIKSRLTLSEVLHYYGLKPDRYHRIHCPFHEDKTPSMQVYYKTHTAYCFSGNCKTHGKSLDVIDFILYKENLSKGEAIQKAVQMISGEASPAEPLSRTAVLTKMFTYFKNAVYHSQPAKDYLAGRGLDHEVLTAAGFAAGYNSGQFHHGARKEEAFIASCVKAGLLIPSGTKSRSGGEAYKAFAKESLCFALRSRSAQVSGLYFRSIVNEEEAKHYYLKDSAGLYPGYPKAETEKLILTEAVIDAATLLQIPEITKTYGILSAYGTNRLTAEHTEAVSQLRHLKEIIFAFDNDLAGNKAVEKYALLLKELLPAVTISKLELPEGEDVNSVGQSHQNGIFLHLLEKRSFLFSSGELPQADSKEEELKKPVEKKKETEPEQSATAPQLNTKNPFKISYKTETASYHIQGGVSKLLDSLKVTLVVEHPQSRQKSRNKLDLYEDKQVEKVCKEAGEKLALRKDLLEADVYRLTDLLEEFREQELLQAGEQTEQEEVLIPLTAEERQQIENFAQKPNLIERLGGLLGKAGIVGEEKNRIFLLIIASSYKMPETLHALIQGSSGSGKTRLLKQISDCIPKEKVTKLTRVSDKVLYNYPEKYFINRLLCLEDIDGLSEEAEFAFRELQSNGELNSATSSKLENGQIVAGQKTVKGPIASLACTTRGEIYEDNMSRVFLIAVDESAEQTRRIIDYQNKKAAGLIDKQEEKRVMTFIQNFLRELKPCEVVNPYANQLHLPEEAHKIRRLNDLFQSFVKMVTVLNQYQRKKDGRGRLITEAEDLEAAIGILFESIVLKVDELDGSLRQFYEQLKEYLKRTYNGSHQKVDFSLLEVRQTLHLSKTQLFRYVNDLMQLEYLRQTGGHANRGFKYRIAHWDSYQAIREKIKQHLEKQLAALKTERQGTPPERQKK